MYNGTVGTVSGLGNTEKDCFVVNIGDGFVYMGGKSDNGSGIYGVKNGVATLIDGTNGAQTNQVLGIIDDNGVQSIIVYSNFADEGRRSTLKIRDNKLILSINIDESKDRINFEYSYNIKEDNDEFILWHSWSFELQPFLQDIPYFTDNAQNIIQVPASFIQPNDDVRIIYKSGKIEILNLYNLKQE